MPIPNHCIECDKPLTNDDGYRAKGIVSLKKLALEIATEDEVYIVAPSKNQSAKSRSITYKHSFEIKKEHVFAISSS